MNSYVCKKSITLSGRLFTCGEIITSDYILPERTLALIKSGYIAEIDSGLMDMAEEAILVLPRQEEIEIPIISEKGTSGIKLSTEKVVKVLTVIQMNPKEALKEIESIKDEGSLLLICTLSNKKAVQEAAEIKNIQLRKGDE